MYKLYTIIFPFWTHLKHWASPIAWPISSRDKQPMEITKPTVKYVIKEGNVLQQWRAYLCKFWLKLENVSQSGQILIDLTMSSSSHLIPAPSTNWFYGIFSQFALLNLKIIYPSPEVGKYGCQYYPMSWERHVVSHQRDIVRWGRVPGPKHNN